MKKIIIGLIILVIVGGGYWLISTDKESAEEKEIRSAIESVLASPSDYYVPMPEGIKLLGVNVSKSSDKAIITLNFSKELISQGATGFVAEDIFHRVTDIETGLEGVDVFEFEVLIEDVPLIVYIEKEDQELQKAIDEGHQPWRLETENN